MSLSSRKGFRPLETIKGERSGGSQVTINREGLIHRDQQVELILSPFQQSAVFDASPAKERHRFDHVTGQVSPEPPVEVFV